MSHGRLWEVCLLGYLNATDKTPMYEMPLTFCVGVLSLAFCHKAFRLDTNSMFLLYQQWQWRMELAMSLQQILRKTILFRLQMMLPQQRMRVGEVIGTRTDFKSQGFDNLENGLSSLHMLLARIQVIISNFGSAGMCSINSLDLLLVICGYIFQYCIVLRQGLLV